MADTNGTGCHFIGVNARTEKCSSRQNGFVTPVCGSEIRFRQAMKSFLSAVFIFVVMVFNSRAVTYTNGFICGSNLISNPLGVGTADCAGQTKANNSATSR